MDRRKVGTWLLRTPEERCRRDRHLGARSAHDDISPQAAGEIAVARDGSLSSTARADAEALFGIRSRRRRFSRPRFPPLSDTRQRSHPRSRIRSTTSTARCNGATGGRSARSNWPTPSASAKSHFEPRRCHRRGRSSRFCEVRAIGTKWLRRTQAPASSISTMACSLSRCIRR